MAQSHVVSGLVERRAEMAGLIEHHQKEMSRLADDLQHLDVTIKLFAPEFDLRTVRCKAHRQRNQYFKQGECQRLVLEVFRDADGAVLSSRQIAEHLVELKGLAKTTEMIEQLQKNAIAITKRLEESGILTPADRSGAGRTWRLAD